MKKYKILKNIKFGEIVNNNIDSDVLLNYFCFFRNTERKFSNEIIPNSVFEDKEFEDIAWYIINTPKLLNFLIDNKYIEEIIEFKPITITIETLEEFKSLYCYTNCEHMPEVQKIIKANNKKEITPKFNSLYRIWSELEEIKEGIL